jgi:ribulose-phosphate 3-epimerase
VTVNTKLRIAPSILSADFLSLGTEIDAVSDGGADLLHVDVMDGSFVPNISIGLPIVSALKRHTELPLDVHMMVREPERHIEAFVAAGAAMISVHIEASPHIHRTLSTIRALGVQAGIAINPGTPTNLLHSVAEIVDYVVVMSVNPGYAGQSFIVGTDRKVNAVRALLDEIDNRAPIEVDGGINSANARLLVNAGAEILVAASAIFGTDDPATATQSLREAATLNAAPASRNNAP